MQNTCRLVETCVGCVTRNLVTLLYLPFWEQDKVPALRTFIE